MLMFAFAVEDVSYVLIEIYDICLRLFGGVEVWLCCALTVEVGKVVAQVRMVERLEEVYFVMLGVLVAVFEAKDVYMNDYAIEIVELVGAVCDELWIVLADFCLICFGAFLHDIGKINI